MNGVGVDFVKYIKSFPADTDFNAKEVNRNLCVLIRNYLLSKDKIIQFSKRFQFDLQRKM